MIKYKKVNSDNNLRTKNEVVLSVLREDHMWLLECLQDRIIRDRKHMGRSFAAAS
jgi:hypothetical protein